MYYEFKVRSSKHPHKQPGTTIILTFITTQANMAVPPLYIKLYKLLSRLLLILNL